MSHSAFTPTIIIVLIFFSILFVTMLCAAALVRLRKQIPRFRDIEPKLTTPELGAPSPLLPASPAMYESVCIVQLTITPPTPAKRNRYREHAYRSESPTSSTATAPSLVYAEGTIRPL